MDEIEGFNELDMIGCDNWVCIYLHMINTCVNLHAIL